MGKMKALEGLRSALLVGGDCIFKLKTAKSWAQQCHAVLDHRLRSIDVEKSPGGLVKMQIPTQQMWGGIRDTVFLMSSQLMPMLLVYRLHSE